MFSRVRRQALKILMIEPNGKGGICHYAYQLCNSLSVVGVDVILYTSRNYELDNYEKGFKVRKTLKVYKPGKLNPVSKLCRRLETIFLWLRLSLAFLLARPACLHFQWLSSAKREPIFLRWLKFLGLKIVYTAHDVLPHEGDDAQATPAMFQNIYNIVDGIIVHSQSDREELLRLFRVDSSKVFVIPHGTYDMFAKGSAIEFRQARREIGLSEDYAQRLILFFGAIKKYKGLPYLIRAFKEVKENVGNVKLAIVGGVRAEEGEDLAFYTELIRSLNLEADTLFVPDYVPVATVPYYFASADVVVLPYLKTYQSGPVQIAYAFGKPVVVTDTGGLPEVVEDGKSGFIVPPKDSHKLAQAIVDILSDGKRLAEMGSYAKRLSETKYSWESIARQTLSLYEKLQSKD